MIKSRFFPRKDEIVLSALTTLIVIGLSYQGLTSLMSGKEHAIFHKNSIAVLPKK